jgi:adenylate cyclase class 2
MQEEVEAKFLNVSHEDIRQKLQGLNAKLSQPMRLMRRTVFDYPDRRMEKNHQRLRVRDEGDKITITFKSRGTGKYAEETETTVGSYETTCALLKSIGLEGYSAQESKREAWHYKGAEVVLDEWPWARPFIEIEGPDESTIMNIANELGFDWSSAFFGPAESVYRDEYPGMQEGETIGEVAVLSFDGEKPKWLAEREQARSVS